MTQNLKFHFAKANEIRLISKFHANASCARCPGHTERKKREEWADDIKGINNHSYKIMVVSTGNKLENMLGYLAFEDVDNVVRLKEVCTTQTKYPVAEKQIEKLMGIQLSMYLQRDNGKTIYGQSALQKPNTSNLKELLVLACLPRVGMETQERRKIFPVIKARSGPYIE